MTTVSGAVSAGHGISYISFLNRRDTARSRRSSFCVSLILQFPLTALIKARFVGRQACHFLVGRIEVAAEAEHHGVLAADGDHPRRQFELVDRWQKRPTSRRRSRTNRPAVRRCCTKG